VSFSFFPPLIIFTVAVFAIPNSTINNYEFILAGPIAIRRWIMDVAPWIDIFRHANSTRFISTAQLSSAIGLIFSIWLALGVAFSSFLLGPSKIFADQFDTKSLVIIVLSPCLTLFCLYSHYSIPGDPSFGAGLTSKSLFGYYIMSLMVILFNSAACALAPPCLIAAILRIKNKVIKGLK
jgi:hypothetical protein